MNPVREAVPWMYTRECGAALSAGSHLTSDPCGVPIGILRTQFLPANWSVQGVNLFALPSLLMRQTTSVPPLRMINTFNGALRVHGGWRRFAAVGPTSSINYPEFVRLSAVTPRPAMLMNTVPLNAMSLVTDPIHPLGISYLLPAQTARTWKRWPSLLSNPIRVLLWLQCLVASALLGRHSGIDRQCLTFKALEICPQVL